MCFPSFSTITYKSRYLLTFYNFKLHTDFYFTLRKLLLRHKIFPSCGKQYHFYLDNLYLDMCKYPSSLRHQNKSVIKLDPNCIEINLMLNSIKCKLCKKFLFILIDILMAIENVNLSIKKIEALKLFCRHNSIAKIFWTID